MSNLRWSWKLGVKVVSEVDETAGLVASPRFQAVMAEYGVTLEWVLNTALNCQDALLFLQSVDEAVQIVTRTPEAVSRNDIPHVVSLAKGAMDRGEMYVSKDLQTGRTLGDLTGLLLDLFGGDGLRRFVFLNQGGLFPHGFANDVDGKNPAEYGQELVARLQELGLITGGLFDELCRLRPNKVKRIRELKALFLH